MSWTYKITERAIKQLRKLGSQASQRVIAFLDERIQGSKDPRQFGKALRCDLGEFWRYRVGDCRALCQLDDGKVVVLVVELDQQNRKIRYPKAKPRNF